MLQYGNHDLAELLNPAVEAHNVFDASDEDIYQAVMEAKGARGLSATSGGDDNDRDGPIESAPTWNEALQAALLLHKYMKDLLRLSTPNIISAGLSRFLLSFFPILSD